MAKVAISTRVRRSASLGAMVAWHALVAADCAFAIDVFPSRDQAEEALADVLADEPGFADLLSVVEIDLTGSAAVAEHSAR